MVVMNSRTKASPHLTRYALALSAVLALATAGCSARPQATITVDSGQRYQTMEAWEATAKMWEFDKQADRYNGSWLPLSEAILTKMIADGGINRLRLEIRSGAENPVDYWSQFRSGKIGYLGFKEHFYDKINDNDDPEVLNPAGVQFSELDFRVEKLILPAMRIAKQLGKTMTISLCYVDFRWTDTQGTLSHAKNPAEYAELIAATYAHLNEKYGLVPQELEIILEPDNSVDWRGEQIGHAILAVTERLERQGVTPRIIAPSTSIGRKTPAYFDALAKVPGAAEKVSVLSYHRYGGVLPEDVLKGIRKRADKIGAETGMLEYTHSDVDDLFADLTIANASSWQKYGITKVEDGGGLAPGNMLTVSDPESAQPDIRLMPTSISLAQIFRSVDPGAVRVGATSNQGWSEAVAFTNPDGRMSVTVKSELSMTQKALQKLSKHVDTPVPGPDGGQWVQVKGLRDGKYLVERSNALIGGGLRCTATVDADTPPRVYLRSSDVATLTQMKKGAPAKDAPCSSDSADWQ